MSQHEKSGSAARSTASTVSTDARKKTRRNLAQQANVRSADANAGRLESYELLDEITSA